MQTQIRINGVIEVDGEIERDKEYSIALERVAYDPCKNYQSRINKDDVEVRTYPLENLGRVNILTNKDGQPFLLKGKSKKVTKSQILRLDIENSGRDYDKTMDLIIKNWTNLLI
jgi:hypothetical protein